MRRRVGRVAIWVVTLAVLAGGVWLVADEVRTNGRIAAAEAALDADNPAEAIRLLERPLRQRSESAKVHFLAARACRRVGDLGSARQHLARAKALDWPVEALEIETALLQVQSDTLAPEYDYYLRKCLAEDHPDTKWIAEILAPYDFRQFRLLEAQQTAELWTAKQPTAANAWALLGDIRERLRNQPAARTAYEKAVEHAPAHPGYRLALARVLMALKVPPDQPSAILEQLQAESPTDANVLVCIAYCRLEQGRLDEAEPILDRLLQTRPTDVQGLHLRGRLEMMRDRPQAAVGYFRRCVELAPFETDLLFSWMQALNRTGPPDEAARVRERWDRSKADLAELNETVRKIAQEPQRADYRATAGDLCLRNGLEKEGVQWLQSGLRVDPAHAPTHQLLAAHYTKIGRPDRAAYHANHARKPAGK